MGNNPASNLKCFFFFHWGFCLVLLMWFRWPPSLSCSSLSLRTLPPNPRLAPAPVVMASALLVTAVMSRKPVRLFCFLITDSPYFLCYIFWNCHLSISIEHVYWVRHCCRYWGYWRFGVPVSYSYCSQEFLQMCIDLICSRGDNIPQGMIMFYMIF